MILLYYILHLVGAVIMLAGCIYIIQLLFWFCKLDEGRFQSKKEALKSLMPILPVYKHFIKQYNDLPDNGKTKKRKPGGII